MRDNDSLVMLRLHRFTLVRRLCIQHLTDDTGLYYGQAPLLRFVSENPGCTQHDAAQSLGVSEPAVATSVKRLVKAGMLERRQDDTNMRRNLLWLTDKGDSVACLLMSRIMQLDYVALSGFTDKEVEFFCWMLDTMTGNIAEGNVPGVSMSEIGNLIAMVKKNDKENRSAVEK